jgi:hypothetical protein
MVVGLHCVMVDDHASSTWPCRRCSTNVLDDAGDRGTCNGPRRWRQDHRTGLCPPYGGWREESTGLGRRATPLPVAPLLGDDTDWGRRRRRRGGNPRRVAPPFPVPSRALTVNTDSHRPLLLLPLLLICPWTSDGDSVGHPCIPSGRWHPRRGRWGGDDDVRGGALKVWAGRGRVLLDILRPGWVYIGLPHDVAHASWLWWIPSVKMGSGYMHMEGRSHSIRHRGRLITAEDVSLPIIPVDAGSVMLGPAIVGSIGPPVNIVRVVVRRSSSPRVPALGAPPLLDLKTRSWAGQRKGVERGAGCHGVKERVEGGKQRKSNRGKRNRGVKEIKVWHSSTVFAEDAFAWR